MREQGRAGKAVGIIMFIVGIALLVVAFVSAYRYFHSPVSSIGLPKPGGVASPSSQLADSAIAMATRIAALIVMTIIGSAVAGLGIRMYFHGSARREQDAG